MLENEFQYYLDHQSELVKQYDGKFLIIVNNAVIGAYDTKIEAYEKGKESYGEGKFLIQRCSQGNSDYSQSFYSRVSFA